MQQHKFKIIISGGGTGGHVFPAIAIANALKTKVNDVEILFVGAKGRMEMEKVPAAGYKIEGLWISGLQRSLSFKNLSFPFKLICSLLKAKKIIRKFKPDAVVGVGGYASGPTLRMAALKNIPVIIQEQNSYPGITNKLLAKYADKICVAYSGMERYFPESKILITGNPVRHDVIDIKDKKKDASEFFRLDHKKTTILVVGGSLGAVSINESIRKNLEIFQNQEFQLIWQTGKNYINTAKDIVSDNDDNNIRVVEFIKRMDYAYAMADIVISRAGAIAISELCSVGKPTIFIPLPSAAEDHQTKNAMELVKNKAALMIKDKEASEKISKEITDLINDKDLRITLSRNIKNMAFENSSAKIADEIVKIINK